MAEWKKMREEEPEVGKIYIVYTKSGRYVVQRWVLGYEWDGKLMDRGAYDIWANKKNNFEPILQGGFISADSNLQSFNRRPIANPLCFYELPALPEEYRNDEIYSEYIELKTKLKALENLLNIK